MVIRLGHLAILFVDCEWSMEGVSKSPGSMLSWQVPAGEKAEFAGGKPITRGDSVRLDNDGLGGGNLNSILDAVYNAVASSPQAWPSHGPAMIATRSCCCLFACLSLRLFME
jgi:hypothetical protein